MDQQTRGSDLGYPIITFVALIIAAFASANAHEAGGPRMSGGGDDLTIEYPVASRNVVGGAVATLKGGGDDLVYSAAAGAAAQRGRALPVMSGGGDNMQITYAPAPDLLEASSARHPVR